MALDRLGDLLQGQLLSGSAVILASGRASTESLGLVRRLFDRFDVTAAVQVPLGDEAPLAGIPNLALRRERVPNLDGAELLGYTAEWDTAVQQAARAAVVVLLDVDLSDEDAAVLAAASGKIVALVTVASEILDKAELVLPVTTMAEENGTYVNRDRRVQRYHQAKSQPGMAQPAWWVAAEVLAGPGPSPDAPSTAAEAFELLGKTWPAFAGLTYAHLGFTGHVLPAEVGAGVGAAR
jgi:hypothetical protein